MRVVVTGSAGFIGKHVADGYAEAGHDVFGLDRNRLAETPVTWKKQIWTDLSRYEAFGWLDEVKPDLINHHAGFVSVPLSWQYPAECFENNTVVTANLAKYCTDRGIPLIFSSTAAVYSHEESLPLREDGYLAPRSPYGISKLAAEYALGAYYGRGLRTAILRYSNVYGPSAKSDGEGGVISRFVEAAKKGEPLVIQGNGKQTRDFIHVSDVVQANVEAGRRLCREEVSRYYSLNVSSNIETSINELAYLALEVYNREGAIVYAPARPSDVSRSRLDNKAIRMLFGWYPKVSLYEGINSV